MCVASTFDRVLGPKSATFFSRLRRREGEGKKEKDKECITKEVMKVSPVLPQTQERGKK